MIVTPKIIDVWDVQTLDSELLCRLETNADLICAYVEKDREIFLSHDLGRGPRRSILRPENPHAANFSKLHDAIVHDVDKRTIRAFHYTRLTESEVMSLTQNGIYLSTPETLRERLDAVVASGGLARTDADRLYAKSPFNSDQRAARSDKFWLTSHPIAVDDRGVVPLMKWWGGEVASMWVRDAALVAPLTELGEPRIIEVAVPLNATKHAYSAAGAIIATFARSRGATSSKSDFDLYVNKALPHAAVIAVHTKGDAAFESMGRDYPKGFVDVNLGRWEELTGDEN